MVEDDADALEALGDLLESHGYGVASAHNGAEALEVLGRSPLPNLIVLDLLMPTMDGWEFRDCQRLVPALGGLFTSEDVTRCSTWEYHAFFSIGSKSHSGIVPPFSKTVKTLVSRTNNN